MKKTEVEKKLKKPEKKQANQEEDKADDSDILCPACGEEYKNPPVSFSFIFILIHSFLTKKIFNFRQKIGLNALSATRGGTNRAPPT